MCDVPETQGRQGARLTDEERADRAAAEPERGRLTVLGCRTDDGGACALVVVNEADGSWSFHGPGEPGVRLTCDMVVVMADAIRRHAR